MGDTAIASIIAAAIAGLVGWATSRQSRKAQEASAKAAAEAAVANQTVSSRTDLERDAFERAKGFYTDTIDRQHAEHIEDQEEIAGLNDRVRSLEAEKVTDRRKITVLENRVSRLERDNEKLRSDLLVATRLLGEKYPDES